MMQPQSRPRLESDALVHALEASTESVEIDDAEGSIVFANDAWCRLFDRDRGEVIGAKWDALDICGEERAALRASWARCIASGRAEGAFSLTRADGTSQRVSHTRILYRDEDRATTAAITIYRPLRHVATGYEATPLLTAALEESSGCTAALDAEGCIVTANRAFTELCGYERNEIAGVHLSGLFPGAHRVLSAVQKGHDPWSGEAELRPKEGLTTPLSMFVTPAKNAQGAADGFIVRVNSVPRQVITADAIVGTHRSDTERVTHSLRNLLTSMVFNLDLLEGAIEDQTAQRRLALVLSAVRSGMALLDDM